MWGGDENSRKGYTDPRQAVETCGMVEQMASDEILTGAMKAIPLVGNSPQICRWHHAALIPEALGDSVEFHDATGMAPPSRQQAFAYPSGPAYGFSRSAV